MQDILEHLESVRQALTPDQLREAVQHDMTGNEELFKQVQANPKVRLTSDGKYEYKVIIFYTCIFVPGFCIFSLFDSVVKPQISVYTCRQVPRILLDCNLAGLYRYGCYGLFCC